MFVPQEVAMDGALPLGVVLGPHAHRLRGLRRWEELGGLGSANLARLLDFARKALQDELPELGRDERGPRAEALGQLEVLLRASEGTKPVLPRLRVECFRVGQPVHLLLADTPGERQRWAAATVCEVSKHHNPAWSDHFPSRGYYWRVVARLQDGRALAFSTSEPRVLSDPELASLRRALREDPQFVHIFCENARRDWNPIWCDEAGVWASGEALDLAHWLEVD
jgi:hypothetical protein